MPSAPVLRSITLRSETVVAVAVVLIVLPVYLLTTQVGLNGDLVRYGTDGLQLLCGRGQRVWGNYGFEPVFVVIWLGFAKAWSFLFTDGTASYCVDPGRAMYWLPIFAGVVLIAIQIYVVRVIGACALAFHLLFCLDILLMTLPFNLIRQFVASTMVLAFSSLLIRGRIPPRAFAALLILPALVHWSTWAIAGVAFAALAFVEVERLGQVRVHSMWQVAALMVGGTVLAGLMIYLVDTFLVARFATIVLDTKLFAQLSAAAAVRGMASPVTVAVVLCAVATSRAIDDGFLRVFLVGIAMLYFVGAATGYVPLMERLRANVMPMTYFFFLYAIHKRWLSTQWHLVNAGLLAFSVVNLSRYLLVMAPFADRASFLRLFE